MPATESTTAPAADQGVPKESGSPAESLVVDTQGLTKSYKDVYALKSLDLRVAKNSIFGFLGPNGAGKTTTIKLLLGLTQPTSGTATVFGRDIVEDSIEIRRRVGYLAQDPRYYDHMTARETLRFKARFFFAGPKDRIETTVSDRLEMAGLSDIADRPIGGFSGGERQRLGIAQALINSPDLLILDEPAASLDPMGRRDVLEIMRNLRQEATIFYSTHILDDVQRVSDTVAILNRGELVAEAPIEELLAGTGGVVYAIVLRGDTSEAQERVESQPWVSGIEVVAGDGQVTWNVAVSDEKAAEAQLMRLVSLDEHVTVSEFGRREQNLEDVFMSLIEGSSDD